MTDRPAPAGGFGNAPGVDHVSAAVIADAVTLLSRNWNDITLLQQSRYDAGPDAACGATTWYRLAIITGKGISFPRADQRRRRSTRRTSAPTAAPTTSCASSRTGTATL